MDERAKELRREICVIKAWIRDVTAQKQARLRGIRRELLGLKQEIAQEAKAPVMA